jgi:tRNA (guanine10-N2)-methyltransferase
MKDADEEFCVFELWPPLNRQNEQPPSSEPLRIFFGRLLGISDRDAIVKLSLKTRNYINTTSMDAELALISANMAHAASGRIFLDPFAGTGGFCISAAHFGAVSLGSDIDRRMIRGDGAEKSIVGNFTQYGLEPNWWDGLASDLTNSPFRRGSSWRWVDGIVCDPPYGIREGCKVLGSNKGSQKAIFVDGIPVHL